MCGDRQWWWWLIAKWCPILCHPMDCLPGSSVHGISQARILEWVAISFSRGSSQPRDRTRVCCTGRRILYHCAIWEQTGVGERNLTKMTDILTGSPPPGSIWDTSLLSPLSTLCLPPCPHPHIIALFLKFRAPSLFACHPHQDHVYGIHCWSPAEKQTAWKCLVKPCYWNTRWQMSKGLDNQDSESAKDTFTEGRAWIKAPKISQPERAGQLSGVHLEWLSDIGVSFMKVGERSPTAWWSHFYVIVKVHW